MMNAPGVGLAANQIGILKQIVTIFFVNEETKKETSIYSYLTRALFYILKEKILWKRVVYHYQNNLLRLKDLKKLLLNILMKKII